MTSNLYEISYWPRIWGCGRVRPAMDGPSRNTDEDDSLHERAGQPDCADGLYELYVEYREASRAALLRVTLSPQSRDSLSEEPIAQSKEEFLNKLRAMSDKTRRNFIRKMTSGYELTRLISRDSLLQKYRPAA